MGKFTKGWNKCFAFKHSFIQGIFTKAFGKLSTNKKIRKYRLYQKLYLRCPGKYLEAYLQKAKLDVSNDKKSPLICRIFKTKSGHKVSKTKGISYSRIREIFKGYISQIATTPENFGLYSLRSAGASAVMASQID